MEGAVRWKNLPYLQHRAHAVYMRDRPRVCRVSVCVPCVGSILSKAAAEVEHALVGEARRQDGSHVPVDAAIATDTLRVLADASRLVVQEAEPAAGANAVRLARKFAGDFAPAACLLLRPLELFEQLAPGQRCLAGREGAEEEGGSHCEHSLGHAAACVSRRARG